MKQLTFILFTTCLILACTSKHESSDEAIRLYRESMKIHDEIMPRMDEMYTLETKLKTLRDSLLADSTNNALKITSINEKLVSLEASGKAMMDWMHNIKDVPDVEPPAGHEHHTDHHHKDTRPEAKPEEVLKIQQDQKASIELVRAAMEKSIESAKEILQ